MASLSITPCHILPSSFLSPICVRTDMCAQDTRAALVTLRHSSVGQPWRGWAVLFLCMHAGMCLQCLTHIHTHVHTYVHTYIHTYIYKNKHRMDAPRYVHTYTRSCITRIYMYMYTHMIVHCISPYAMLHSLFALHRILSHHITFNRTFLHVCMYT